MKRASIIFFTPNYSFVALQYIRTLISRSSARSASESPTKDSSVRRFKFFHKSCTCVDREKSSQRMHISSCYCHRVFNHHFFHSSLSINCDYCYRRKKKNLSELRCSLLATSLSSLNIGIVFNFRKRTMTGGKKSGGFGSKKIESLGQDFSRPFSFRTRIELSVNLGGRHLVEAIGRGNWRATLATLP